MAWSKQGPHWSLWSGNCGEVSQWSAAHKKGLTSWKPQREGASQDTDIKKVSGQGARLRSTLKFNHDLPQASPMSEFRTHVLTGTDQSFPPLLWPLRCYHAHP